MFDLKSMVAARWAVLLIPLFGLASSIELGCGHKKSDDISAHSSDLNAGVPAHSPTAGNGSGAYGYGEYEPYGYGDYGPYAYGYGEYEPYGYGYGYGEYGPYGDGYGYGEYGPYGYGDYGPYGYGDYGPYGYGYGGYYGYAR